MFYKVVRLHNGSIQSAIVTSLTWYVEYQVGIPTTPCLRSKLFVFDDLDIATEWANTYVPRYMNWAIYECEVENPTKPLCRSRHLGHLDLKKFWEKYEEIKSVEDRISHCGTVESVENGVVFADSVTLTRMVAAVPKFEYPFQYMPKLQPE